MKKILVFGFLALAALVLSQAIALASGSSTGQSGTPFPWNISLKDLGISNPGILPSNPFYFIKEWSRSIKQVLTTDPVKKLNNDLADMNERVAEIKKLSDISSSDPEDIISAIDKYGSSVVAMKADLVALDSSAANQGTGDFINNLLSTSLKHEEVFDQIKFQFPGDDEMASSLLVAHSKIESLVVVIPAKFDTPDAFKKRLGDIMQSGLTGVTSTETIIFKNLRNIEILDQMSGSFSITTKIKVNELSAGLIKNIEDGLGKLDQNGRADIFNSKTLMELPGDRNILSGILDIIKSQSSDRIISDGVDGFKRAILEKQIADNGYAKEDISAMLKNSGDLIVKIKDSPDPSLAKSVKSQIDDYLVKAQDEINQANKALGNNDLVGAYGLAIAAGNDAESAMNILGLKLIPSAGTSATSTATSTENLVSSTPASAGKK
ncbi:MAG: DUF5667 domain-containing protein [Candidatus Wolfebacteria bacterium]|nr:DUF5667 domain-containing protein [Candidatus Wolfebacteria bacterium]